ncbi:hypothetical protein FQZ97_860110 [compost metagenome]
MRRVGNAYDRLGALRRREARVHIYNYPALRVTVIGGVFQQGERIPYFRYDETTGK